MATKDLRAYTPESAQKLAEETAESASWVNPQATLPAPEAGLGLSLAEARKLYVQRGYERFEKTFARFDAIGKSRLTFAFAPFFFSGGWFLYRKMYLEFFIFLGLLVGTSVFCSFFFAQAAITKVCVTCLKLAVGWSAKGLYWKAVDRKIARAMRLFPDSPQKARVWLHKEGGVNLAVVLLLVALGLFIVALAAYGAYLSR
jgi:hypothetical protein